VGGWLVDCSPHAVIARKRRIHHQGVADKLVVRIVVRQIIENHEGMEERDTEYEKRLGQAPGHGFS
jgi:hypothetical protein